MYQLIRLAITIILYIMCTLIVPKELEPFQYFGHWHNQVDRYTEILIEEEREKDRERERER